MPAPGHQTQTKLHSVTAQQLTCSCVSNRNMTSSNPCRNGGIHCQFAGNMTLWDNSSVAALPSPVLCRAHSSCCLAYNDRELMVHRTASSSVLLHPKRCAPCTLRMLSHWASWSKEPQEHWCQCDLPTAGKDFCTG